MTAAENSLLEIERIKQLKARYFRFVDTKAWADWRGVFTDDMRLYREGPNGPEPAMTADELVSHVSALLADAITVHHGHAPEIKLTSPTTATGVWAMFDWVDQQKEPEESFIGYGHYLEEYEKGGDGQWRIKRMQLRRLRLDYPNRK